MVVGLILGGGAANFAHRVGSVEERDREIENRDLGFQLLREPHRLETVGCFADDVESCAFQQRPHPASHELLIVGQ